MVTRLLRIALFLVIVAAFGLQTARADIYTWVDASGSINVSNLAPPDGVRVTSIMRATPPTATSDGTALDPAQQAKTKALEDRVRQLENEVELSRREAPPPVAYQPVFVPPVVQYIVEPPQVFAQYAVNEVPSSNYGCDRGSFNCGLSWTPGFYPGSVVVFGAPAFRHFRPAPRGHNVGARSLITPLPTTLIQPLAAPLIQPLVPPPLSFHNSIRKG